MKTRTFFAIAVSLLIATVFTAQVKGVPQYQIIEADAPDSLEENVNTLLKQGWKPQGGIAVVFQSLNASPRVRYYQSVMK